MATQGLFETLQQGNPELLRQALAQQAQEQDDKWIQGSFAPGSVGGPAAMAAARGGMLGGRQLGEAIGTMAGNVDPRLAKAEKVKKAVEAARLKTQGNTDKLAMYEALVEAFSNEGLDAEALQAAEALSKAKMDAESFKLKKFEVEEKAAAARARVEAAKAIAEAKAQGKPWAEQAFELLKTGKFDPKTIAKYAETGNPADVEPLDKTEQWSEPFTASIGGKQVMQQRNLKTGAIKTLAGDSPNVTTSVNVDSRNMGTELGWVDTGMKAVEPLRKELSSIRSAIQLIQKGDPTGEELALGLMVQAVQAGRLSNEDIRRNANTGDVATRVANTIQKWASGNVTGLTRKEREEALQVMERIVRTDYNNKVKSFQEIEKRNNYTPGTFFKEEQGYTGSDNGEWQTLPDGTRFRKKK